MPRLLIVSPHFPPVNAPDMQRARMSLPHLLRAGWEITVLAADDPTPLAPLDPELLATVPADARVVRVPAWSRRWTGRLGVNTLGLRWVWPLHRAAQRLLRAERFDAVFFSTTQTIVLPLGRLWRRRWGVPYVVDLQDPWVTDYYDRPGAPRPPGGWKYRFARALARMLEGWTLRAAGHICSVSADYLDALARRYAWFDPAKGSVLAFGASPEDLAAARALAARSARILPVSPACRLVYVGSLGPGFQPALDFLFAAAVRAGATPRAVEFHFLGTSYAAAGAGQATTTELARRHGLADRVHEQTQRLPYLDALRVLDEADAVLLLGSDAAGYAPSKIHPVLFAERPTLAIGPSGSVLEQKVAELGGAAFFPSDGGEEASAALSAMLRALGTGTTPEMRPLERENLEARHSAAAVAARLDALFRGLTR